MLDDAGVWEGESRRTSGHRVEMHTPCPRGPQVEYHASCLPLQIAVCGQVLKSLNGVFHVMGFKRHCDAKSPGPVQLATCEVPQNFNTPN